MFGSSLYTKRGAEGWLPKQDKIDVCVEDVTLFINDMADVCFLRAFSQRYRTIQTVEELAYNDLDATVLTAVVEIRDVLAATVTHAINVTMRGPPLRCG